MREMKSLIYTHTFSSRASAMRRISNRSRIFPECSSTSESASDTNSLYHSGDGLPGPEFDEGRTEEMKTHVIAILVEHYMTKQTWVWHILWMKRVCRGDLLSRTFLQRLGSVPSFRVSSSWAGVPLFDHLQIITVIFWALIFTSATLLLSVLVCVCSQTYIRHQTDQSQIRHDESVWGFEPFGFLILRG